MQYRCRMQYPQTVPSDPGDPLIPICVKAYDDCGNPYLAQHGYRNIYDIVQSHADECCIATIVSKYEAGDATVLDKLQSWYADITDAAANLQDALNARAKVQLLYDRMPDAVRQKWDIDQFLRAVGTDELKSMLLPDKPAAEQEEVADA